MTIVQEIRKTVTDTTPVYAAVGVTDLAVEKVREARDRAIATRKRAVAASTDLDVSELQDKAIKRAEKVAEKVVERVEHLPALALNQTLEAAGKAQETYAELAVRGHKLVKRLRNQKTTKDLVAQANNTVTLGKGAVTTVRKAAVDVERAAKATLTTGRHEAAVVIDAVGASVGREAKVATETVRKSVKATRIPVKRTSTTAKKRATTVRRATKATATSAAKTTTAAAEAVKTASPKVGD